MLDGQDKDGNEVISEDEEEYDDEGDDGEDGEEEIDEETFKKLREEALARGEEFPEYDDEEDYGDEEDGDDYGDEDDEDDEEDDDEGVGAKRGANGGDAGGNKRKKWGYQLSPLFWGY